MYSIFLLLCFLLPFVLSSIASNPHSSIIRSLSLPLLSRQADTPLSVFTTGCSKSSDCPSNQVCALFQDTVSRCFPGVCLSCLSDSDCDSGFCTRGACTILQNSCDEESDCPGETACYKFQAIPQVSGSCVGDIDNVCTSSASCNDGSSCFPASLTVYENIGLEINGNAINQIGVCTPASAVDCERDENCSQGLVCVKRESGNGLCLIADKKCDEDIDCAVDDGKVCVRFGENGQGVCQQDPFEGLFPIGGECRNGGEQKGVGSSDEDESNDENASNGESGVCVDAALLEAAGVEDFVFDKHRIGRVLCDTMGSCATAGHMVEWQGTGMMMKTYCATVMDGGCEDKVVKVNSPKWIKGRRVGSKTTGLKFTAVAARWESRMEEAVLKIGIRLGM